MSIQETLETYDQFTETEKAVTRYILERPGDVLDMKIRDLAQVTYTSAPTVLRVCRKLGFDGYKDFQKELMLELENEKHLSSQVDASRPFRRAETPGRIVGTMTGLYKESIDSTAAMLRLQDMSKVAGQIFHARRIFIYAVGDTQITCRLFANKLLKLNIHPIMAAENYQMKEETYNVTKDDFALFVTYKGVYDAFASCAGVLKRRGIHSCVITCNTESPLTRLCSSAVYLPNTEKISKIATFHSQISIGFVLNVLYSLIYSQDYEAHDQHKSVLDTVSY